MNVPSALLFDSVTCEPSRVNVTEAPATRAPSVSTTWPLSVPCLLRRRGCRAAHHRPQTYQYHLLLASLVSSSGH